MGGGVYIYQGTIAPWEWICGGLIGQKTNVTTEHETGIKEHVPSCLVFGLFVMDIKQKTYPKVKSFIIGLNFLFLFRSMPIICFRPMLPTSFKTRNVCFIYMFALYGSDCLLLMILTPDLLVAMKMPSLSNYDNL